MAIFNLTPGVDTFTGLAGEKNTFRLTPTDLQPADTITGGATGGFIDVLSVTAGGTITAGQFAGVTKIEELDLSAAGNSVTLTNSLVGRSSTGIFNVQENGGNNVVDASGVTNNTSILFQTASGNDTLTGGTSGDIFSFAPSNLTSGDVIAGGAGFDIILLTTAGAVGASSFTNVSTSKPWCSAGRATTSPCRISSSEHPVTVSSRLPPSAAIIRSMPVV